MNKYELLKILEANKKSCFLYTINALMELYPRKISKDELCNFMEVINKADYFYEDPSEIKALMTNNSEIEDNEPAEESTISIPTVIFGYWFHMLSVVELKVLICFFINEFCDGHPWRTHVEQIEKLTGLSKGEIYICLQVLHTYGIIIKVPNYTKDSESDDQCYAIDLVVLYEGI